MKLVLSVFALILAISCSAFAASLAHLPRGTAIVLSKPVQFDIGNNKSPIYNYNDTYECQLVVKQDSVSTGLILNSPITIEVTYALLSSDGRFEINGYSNKVSFVAISCSQGVSTIEGFIYAIEYIGGTIKLPPVAQE